MRKRLSISLGPMVREKRGHSTLREAAREIGIGPATLMRVENGRIPDLATFGKICNWLDVDPRSFLGFKRTASSQGNRGTDEPTALQVPVHLRVDQTPQPETVPALAKMILLALKNQPRIETVPTDDES